MFWGFLFTAAALGFMVILALVEIFRVDRIIKNVDRKLAAERPADKK
jgi:hypothetical protein